MFINLFGKHNLYFIISKDLSYPVVDIQKWISLLNNGQNSLLNISNGINEIFTDNDMNIRPAEQISDYLNSVAKLVTYWHLE